MLGSFITLPILSKNGEEKVYAVNVGNINYIREWKDKDNDSCSTVIYFSGNDNKYLIVNLTMDELIALISDSLLV